MKHTSSALLLAVLVGATAFAYAADTPYLGQEKRAIKALSEQELSDYVNGRGMGTSKAAELNHYPGPKHVLDEAQKLNLSPDQINKAQALFDVMARDAKRVGATIVQKEAELEVLYAKREATTENTRLVVTALAGLQAEFRLIHLNAHLGMREVLSPQQVAQYDHLRGYTDAARSGTTHQHH